MATKKKNDWTQADEDAYQKRQSRKREAAAQIENAEKKARSLSDPSNRLMMTLNYLGGKEKGDAVEASRKKRLEMADADAESGRERYKEASRPPMSKKWIEK